MDHATREFAAAKLKLRDDLSISPQKYGDEWVCHIEDAARGKFFRIGFAEYTFVSLLDGETTVAHALTLTARTLGPKAFSEDEATSICSWLLDNQLATGAGSITASPTKQGRLSERINPFWMKWPLMNPDRILNRVIPWLSWLFSVPMLLICVGLMIAGLAAVANQWDRFQTHSADIFTATGWIRMAAVWFVLKLFHESSHALVCKRYGGQVRDMGAIFILLAPVAYVDVTSSWKFRSRWQRIHTAAAGILTELTLAAVAALWWTRTDNPVLGSCLYDVMLMASLTTLLFNANPLMRFDGYFILSDLLNLPNLYGSSSRFVSQLMGRLFLGRHMMPLREHGLKGAMVRVYGIAASVWRIVVCASLTIAASVMFHGAGLALAAIGVTSWVGRPVVRAWNVIREESQLRPKAIVRLTCASSLLAGAMLLLLVFVPWPGARVLHGVIEHDPLTVVRASSPGFVQIVFVKDGDVVEAGTLLAELRNDELEIELKDLELALAQSALRHDVLMQDKDIAGAQAELGSRRALESQLLEKRAELTTLEIRAAHGGRVMGHNLPQLTGTYLQRGDELVSIGSNDNRLFRVAISQDDIRAVRAVEDQQVKIQLRSGQQLHGKLKPPAPRASRTPIHPALCAPNGGELPVRSASRDDDSDDEFQLLLPHFVGEVAIATDDASRLVSGQTGQIAIRDREESLGSGIYYRIREWVEATSRMAR